MGNNTAIFSLILVAVCITILQLFNMYHEKHMTIEKAVDPVNHLSNAYHHIINNNYNGSVREMDEAITAMEIIEGYSDSTAVQHIEDAIKDLKMVEDEIRADTLSMSDLNRAFFNALNSIAYANLTISEKNLDKGSHYKGMRLLNASFREMITSVKYADDSSKEKEEKVITHVKDILEALKRSNFEATFNYDSLNKEVESLFIE